MFAQVAICALAAMSLLASCSSDSGSSHAPAEETVDKLPDCTSALEGALDTLDGVVYVCQKGDWSEKKSGASSDNSSEKDSTQKDSAQKADSLDVPAKDSSKVDVNDTLTSGEGSEVADTSKTDSSSASKDSSAQESGVKNATVEGLVEYGSLDSKVAVRVSELDDTLALTGVSFNGDFKADGGAFNVKNINLKSSVAKVSAYGKFNNLVNGGSQQMADTLYVLIDASESPVKVNINALSFLASVRTTQLLKDSSAKSSFADLSEKASKEVWDAFHFDKALGAPASQKVLGDKEAGAALLAVTIMMHAVEKDTSANLWHIAADFADGKWDDSSSRAKLADWAFHEDVEDDFETVRTYAEKLGAVPDFEKYLRQFYQAELGFSGCSSENAGEIVFAKNPYSAYYASEYSDISVTGERFVCDASKEAWRAALDKEKDIYGFEAGEDGDVRQGQINGGVVYSYNSASGTWKVVSSASVRDAFYVKKSAIEDFIDIQEVYESIKDGERAIFLLRHAERDKDVTSKEGTLTAKGIQESKDVGARLTKFDEPFRLGASEFYRAQQTVISMAQGRGQDTVVADTLPELNDDWYMRDRSLVNQAESAAGGGWEATSLYTYTGAYTEGAEINAYYNLAERSAELIEDVLLAKYADVPERFVLLSSHDKLMVPFVAYCSNLKINMNVKNGGTWINYLAGIAIIWDKSGNRRYVAFKGLESAYFQGW